VSKQSESELTAQKFASYARGWLELGKPDEAEKELNGLDSVLLNHREILRVRFDIYAETNRWENAYTTAVLLCRAPNRLWRDAYSLARAAIRTGRKKDAYDTLKRAAQFTYATKEELRRMAMDDPELQEIWKEIIESE
jgi:predicted Zn-dependent protease